MSEDMSRAVNFGDSGLNHARFEHVHNAAAQQSFMFSSDPKVIGMLMFSDGQTDSGKVRFDKFAGSEPFWLFVPFPDE